MLCKSLIFLSGCLISVLWPLNASADYTIFQTSNDEVIFIGDPIEGDQLIVREGDEPGELRFQVYSGSQNHGTNHDFLNVSGIYVDFAGSSSLKVEQVTLLGAIVNGNIEVHGQDSYSARLGNSNFYGLSQVNGDLSFYGGSKIDSFHLRSIDITGKLTVEMKQDTDFFTLEDVDVEGDVLIKTGTGEGRIELVDSDFYGSLYSDN